jgi:uncharacterized tellurite resistance protein B-like protein
MFNLKNRILRFTENGIPDPERSASDTLERLRIATCVVLLEVARSDDEFCSLEQAALSAALQEEFRIPKEAVEALMEVAHSKREDAVDLYEFTSLINENYSLPEKIRIVELAWRIIYADKELNRYEDHFVHKLARLLRLHHEDLIEAKLTVLEEVRKEQ